MRRLSTTQAKQDRLRLYLFCAITLGFAILSLANCAPPTNKLNGSDQSAIEPGTTGFTNSQGLPFIHNGDARLDQAIQSDTPAQNSPVPTPSPSPTRPPDNQSQSLPLRERLQEFELRRFADNNSPARNGVKRFGLRVFLKNKQGVNTILSFSGDFSYRGETLLLAAEAQGFELSGEMTDQLNEQRVLTQTSGKLILVDKQNPQDMAEIFYRAFRARLNVRADLTQPQVANSQLNQHMQTLRDKTFAWVNNWNVLKGPAFYLVDFIQQVSSTQSDTSPLFVFKGESLRTGESQSPEIPVQTGGSPNPPQASLVGNSESESRRAFSVHMQDPQTQQRQEFMIDIESEDPEPQAAAPVLPVNTPPSRQPRTPQPQDNQQSRPNQKAYLQADLSQARIRKMESDFQKNSQIPGVQEHIRWYQRNGRRSLQNFYDFAHPFRPLLETVASSFQVSPAFAYLTVVESAYFTGGRYQIQANGDVLGPFQFKPNTAKEVGLRVTFDRNDERRFFAPSACGAARYVSHLLNRYHNRDSTIAILGFNQGEGGAAAAIYCSYAEDARNREACARRINSRQNGFGSADYERFLRLVQRFNYTYREMERLAAIPQAMRTYVNKKLAVYFISSDLDKYGFQISSRAPTRFPQNGTLVPASGINDRACRTSVARILTQDNVAQAD